MPIANKYPVEDSSPSAPTPGPISLTTIFEITYALSHRLSSNIGFLAEINERVYGKSGNDTAEPKLSNDPELGILNSIHQSLQLALMHIERLEEQIAKLSNL